MRSYEIIRIGAEMYKLMEEYTRIDYLMAETLLMQTEEELERYLAMPIENNVNE